MKIKRYTAASMRSALDQVRVEQGPDAVILSSRRLPDGIEVIAAVDYDETLMFDARVHRAPPPPPAQETVIAPAMASAVARPPLTSHIRSARPWITRVGTSICRSRSVRSPEATDATA